MTAQLLGAFQVPQGPTMSLKRKKKAAHRRRLLLPPLPARNPIGQVLREPAPPAPPPEEPEEPRQTLAEAQAAALMALADPGALLDDLNAAVRFFPSRVLKHPAMTLYALTDPGAWKSVTHRAHAKLLNAQWKRLVSKLTLSHCRTLSLAYLRRCAPILDARLSPTEPGLTTRVAHFLEATMRRELALTDARALYRAGITGGPAPVVVETINYQNIEDNAEAQGIFASVFSLIVLPLRRLRTRLRGKARGQKRRRRRFLPSPREQRFEALTALFYLDADSTDSVTALRWQIKAARAVLAGKPVSA